MAARTEPAHGVDDWIKLGKKKGAKVILLKKELLWPTLSRGLRSNAGRICVIQHVAKDLQQLPTLKLLLANVRL